MSPPEDRPASRGAWLLAFLVAVATLVPFWTCALVPTQDGPAHLFNAWLLVHFDDPVLQAGRFFQVNVFVPNWGGVGPLVPLLLVAPPPLAEKLFFSVIALVVVLGAAALAARLGGDPVLAAAVAVSVAHGWLVAMGFTGFVLGLGLGLALCAWTACRPVGAERASVAATALGLAAGFALLFFLHLAAAALGAAVAAIVLVARLDPQRKARPSPVLALPFVMLALLMGAHFLKSLGRALPPYRPDPRGVLGRLLELPAGACWESYSPADRALGAAVVVLVLGLVLARATRRAPAPRPAVALLLATPVVLIAYLFVPFASGGGAYLTDRLVPLLMLLPLPWATSRGLPQRGALRAAALLLAAAVLLQRGAQYRAWGRVIETLVELNRDITPGVLLAQAAWPQPVTVGVDPRGHLWGRVAIETRTIPLDDYEAALAGFFPIAYTEEAQALAAAWNSRAAVPRGTAMIRQRQPGR